MRLSMLNDSSQAARMKEVNPYEENNQEFLKAHGQDSGYIHPLPIEELATHAVVVVGLRFEFCFTNENFGSQRQLRRTGIPI